MAKVNVKAYQQKVDFLEKELYPKRDELNVALYELGEADILHSVALDQVYLEDDANDMSAWKVYVMGHYGADMTNISRIRVLENELNQLLIHAAQLGVVVIIGDPFQIMLDPNLVPEKDDEMYTGRLAWQLSIFTPNLDDSVIQQEESTEPESPQE